MKHSTSHHVVDDNENVIGIQVSVFDNGILDKQFTIPVTDVRNPGVDREKVKEAISVQNRSKYMLPSFSVIGASYQVSHKRI